MASKEPMSAVMTLAQWRSAQSSRSTLSLQILMFGVVKLIAYDCQRVPAVAFNEAWLGEPQIS